MPKRRTLIRQCRGVARIFQKGVTLGQSEGTHQIAMPFAPPVVGCLLKKKAYKGGVMGTPGPTPPSPATPLQRLAKIYIPYTEQVLLRSSELELTR